MRNKRLVFILLFPVLLIGCQSTLSTNSGFFSGKSAASSALKRDTVQLVSMFVMANGCGKINHIETSVLDFDPRNGIKNHIWSKEKWMVTGCGKTFPFHITYSEDGGTGSFIKVSEENTN